MCHYVKTDAKRWEREVIPSGLLANSEAQGRDVAEVKDNVTSYRIHYYTLATLRPLHNLLQYG